MKYVMQILKRMGVFLSCTALALTMAGPAGLYVRAAEQPPEGIGKTADAPDSENPDPGGTEGETPGEDTLSRITSGRNGRRDAGRRYAQPDHTERGRRTEDAYIQGWGYESGT